jgi:hypothetical protein
MEAVIWGDPLIVLVALDLRRRRLSALPAQAIE